jgi:ParB family chromosome partitioning protein
VEAYTEAGGTILRDLFTEDRGGYFEDVALFDLLVTAKLGREADALREAEGWKWTEVHLDFPHAHGMRRTYPHPVELSVEDHTALEAARCEVDQLAEWNQTAGELPDHVDARLCELEAVSERLEAKRQAYDPDDITRGGVFVILNHDGMVRIELGFIRPEDERPRPEAELAGEASVAGDTEGRDSQTLQHENGERESATGEEDDDRPLSDSVVRDLTAHRTLGLRLDLSDQPEVALVAAPRMRSPRKSSTSARTRMLSASSRSRQTWQRMRTGSKTLRPGRRGRIATPTGQGRCPAMSPVCGPS